MTGVDAVVAKLHLLIVGAGGHGRYVAVAVLISGDFDLVGFLDDGAFANVDDVWGLPLLGPAEGFADCAAVASHALVAIGGNALRQKFSGQMKLAGYALASVIHPRAIVSPSAHLEEGIALMAGAIVGTEAVLAQGVIVNCGSVVDHHAQVQDFDNLGVNACMAGESVLGALAWMQAGAAIGYGVQWEAGRVLKLGESL